jgi:hypothetical protein
MNHSERSKEAVRLFACPHPKCEGDRPGKRCTTFLITGKVCRWARSVPIDYVHRERRDLLDTPQSHDQASFEASGYPHF